VAAWPPSHKQFTENETGMIQTKHTKNTHTGIFHRKTITKKEEAEFSTG